MNSVLFMVIQVIIHQTLYSLSNWRPTCSLLQKLHLRQYLTKLVVIVVNFLQQFLRL